MIGHGPQTGRCITSDRNVIDSNISVCEVKSWCPIENDNLAFGLEEPLIKGSEDHTVFIKNSIRFSYFGESFHRNNMPKEACLYNFTDPSSHMCNIFRLGKTAVIFLFLFLSEIGRRYSGSCRRKL